ncbi:putative Hybrid PKS-NRPS biosynthetic cluster [Aspergillus udagawae]|uniref:Hybrid PKS-NRPS biosynthetic cluster n=1 Tax=Aspergillus udagawae TaxID=91492 RepID=A0A8E0QYN4_9EURO|nr:putative Hybrid PKS-NRPS biosynthetic cluster [Aspergillus udagawae]GIC93729.1 putative Hybrid PKS-NRPS biosynthetic cluster [Aspergillus udagawae]
MLGLAVPAVFEFPTLSALAPVIHERRIEDHIPSLPRPEWAFSYLLASVTEKWQSSDIVAVLPTTDFQRVYLNAGLKNYYIWRIDRPIDADQLQRALQILCDQVLVLRSLFIRHADTTLQVVLRRMQVELIQTTINQESVDEECRSWCANHNRSPDVPDGSPYFQPMLISSKPSKHILILRLSHAQFDGSTLPRLLGDLVREYQDHALPQPVVDFTAYLQHRLARRTPAAYYFWRDYLHEAFIHRAFMVGFDNFTLSSPPRGITMATLVKAPWALAWARLGKQTDLVFGHTVSGRNMPIPDVDQRTGYCINTAPIRVHIQPAWTAHELLRHFHTQYTRTLDYETIEPSEIIVQCTAWQGKPGFSASWDSRRGIPEHVMAGSAYG